MSQNLYIPSIFSWFACLLDQEFKAPKRLYSVPYIVCTGGQLHDLPPPINAIKFHTPKKIGSHLMTPLLKQFEKKKRKEVKTSFPKATQKIVPFFSFPFSWATPACSFFGKSFCDPIYLGWKKNSQGISYRSSSVSFFHFGVILSFFKWKFVLVFHFIFGSHFMCMNVFEQSHSFCWTTKIICYEKTAKTRTNLGLSGVIRLPTQIMHYLHLFTTREIPQNYQTFASSLIPEKLVIQWPLLLI